MITEGAIGDVYGAGFEFADLKKIKGKNPVSTYEKNPPLKKSGENIQMIRKWR